MTLKNGLAVASPQAVLATATSALLLLFDIVPIMICAVGFALASAGPRYLPTNVANVLPDQIADG